MFWKFVVLHVYAVCQILLGIRGLKLVREFYVSKITMTRSIQQRLISEIQLCSSVERLSFLSLDGEIFQTSGVHCCRENSGPGG